MDGRLAIHSDTFNMTKAFTSRLKEQPLDAAQNVLREQIKQAMAVAPRLFEKALASDESADGLTDPLTDVVRHFNGTFEQFASNDVFGRWQQANPSRGDPGNAFILVLAALDNADMPLVHNDTSDDPSSDYASFAVLDPFDSACINKPSCVNIELPGMIASRAKGRIPQLQKRLHDLDGGLWSSRRIRDALAPFYRNLGLPAEVTIFPRDELIRIIEGQRIASIVLPASDVSLADVDQLLWDLLNKPDFGNAMRRKAAWLDGRVLNFRRKDPKNAGDSANDNLGYEPGDEPYVIQYTMQEQQLLVSQLGYAFTLQPSTQLGTSQYVDLRVQKADSASGGDTTTKPKANSDSADTKGLVQTDLTKPAPEIVGTGVRDTDKSSPKDKIHRIAGGFEYKPGQGFNGLGLFQASRLKVPVANGTASIQAGGPFQRNISGNYFADFLNFGGNSGLHQRIAVRLNAETETTTHRFLLNKKLDESNTNELAHVEWQPFRDWGGTLLTVHADAKHATVKLSTNSTAVSSQNLNSAEFGVLLLSRSVQNEYPQRTQLESTVIVAPGVGANENAFAHAVVAASRHQAFDSWDYDIAGRFEAATRGTPIFEQPSFGGAAIVRGFRADDAVGLRLWSLQSELWHPVPGLSSAKIADDQIRSIVQKVKLAGFFDMGGAYQTSGSTPGSRYGSGLGIRMDFGLAVLKFDWAYGFGEAATGGSKGKFYFSVVTTIPF